MSIFGRRRTDNEPRLSPASDRPAAASSLDSKDLPHATIAFCAKHRIYPAPAIYETVFTYLSGTISALNLAFASELARGPLTQHSVLRIHDDHLHSGKVAQSIVVIGAGLGREVEQMTDVVNAGIDAGSTAKMELTRLTDALERTPSRRSLFEQAGEIRDIGLRQLAANMTLRETLRVTRGRLNALEQDLARHMEEANTDHLSKLPNRRAIDARLAGVFARPVDTRNPGCLVMVDIDKFKSINDTHGHDIGDSVIRLTAELLKREVGAKGYAARWGGEEFAILAERASFREAHWLAEAIRTSLEAARWTRKKDGVPLGVVTASFGIAERRPEDTPASLAKRADAALYRAKSEGRNRCVVIEG